MMELRVPALAGIRRPRPRRRLAAWLLTFALVAIAGGAARAEQEFTSQLARVDAALRKPPAHVPPLALEACRSRRNFALDLYRSMDTARAQRALTFCFQVLGIPEEPPPAAAIEAPPSMEDLQKRAAAEIEAALALEPDLVRGLQIYRSCAMCHEPEGWGLEEGVTPQIAGQHHSVVIKQLADIRAGNRDAVLMLPYASADAIGGAQAIADVAGYIDSLEMSVATGKGDGKDLELGRKVYEENCRRCHGASGEGDAEAYVPRIQSQHYEYLIRQFEWIKDGRRRNANPEMVAQIQSLDPRSTRAVLDYVSRLEPPPELQAPQGWFNPDFAREDRLGPKGP